MLICYCIYKLKGLHLTKLYCKYSDDFDSFEGIDYPWRTEIFHEKLIEFRKTNPKDFGAIYDSLKTSLSLTQLASDDQVVENVATYHNEAGKKAGRLLEILKDPTIINK